MDDCTLLKECVHDPIVYISSLLLHLQWPNDLSQCVGLKNVIYSIFKGKKNNVVQSRQFIKRGTHPVVGNSDVASRVWEGIPVCL